MWGLISALLFLVAIVLSVISGTTLVTLLVLGGLFFLGLAHSGYSFFGRK